MRAFLVVPSVGSHLGGQTRTGRGRDDEGRGGMEGGGRRRGYVGSIRKQAMVKKGSNGKDC